MNGSHNFVHYLYVQNRWICISQRQNGVKLPKEWLLERFKRFVSSVWFRIPYDPCISMYGIFAYVWLVFVVNVGKHIRHGWYGNCFFITATWLNIQVLARWWPFSGEWSFSYKRRGWSGWRILAAIQLWEKRCHQYQKDLSFIHVPTGAWSWEDNWEIVTVHEVAKILRNFAETMVARCQIFFPIKKELHTLGDIS